VAPWGSIFGCVGHGLIQHGLRALAGFVTGSNVIYDVCAAAAGEWKKSVDRAEERLVIEQMLAKNRDEIKAEVAQQIAELKKNATPEQAQQLANPKVEQGLELYLQTIPDLVRARSRRPEDPSGNSVHSNFSLREENGFAAILPNRTPRFRTGDSVGNFVLTEPLGLGGFGEVWKARHVNLSSRVAAIKFCLDEASHRNLKHESSLIDRVHSLGRQPGIVELWDEFLKNDPPCLVYQFIEGGDLTGLMRTLKTLPVKERETRAVEVLIALTGIIEPLHAKLPPIIHRDLKPANILISRTNGQDSFWVTDFGIGALAANSALSGHRQGISRGDLMGQALRGTYTEVYASPEQKRHADPDPRDDVHALAVIGYQLLLGDPTEEPRSDLEDILRKVGITPALIQVIKDCLRTKRDERLEHAGILADRLKSLTVVPPVKQEIKRALAKELEPIVRDTGKQKESYTGLQVELPKIWIFDLGNGVNLELVLIPSGTFMMGSPDSEAERFSDETQHEVRISNPFYLGKYPITQAQWQQVMGNNPSHFKGDKLLPVENISWDDIQAFCLKLKEITQTPFGIPTEAQWEYACRAGTTTPYYFGNQLNGTQANCNGKGPYGGDKKGPFLDKTTHVWKYPANAWGLHDMHGNVWEWCADWYGDYQKGFIKDPKGASNGEHRIQRGGSWINFAKNCRAATRFRTNPTPLNGSCGGRISLSIE